MKRVFLLRHGKSDWQGDFGSDRERPLAPRGRKAAASVGRFLTAVGEVPDRILTSPAVRARHTVELAMESGAWDRRLEVVDDLYGGGVEAVLGALRRQPAPAESVLVAGHEPTWSMTTSRLIGGGQLIVPTACLVAVDLQVPSWPDVEEGKGELRWMLPPRLLKKAGFDAGGP